MTEQGIKRDIKTVPEMAKEYARHFRGLRYLMTRYRHVISPMKGLLEYVPVGADVLEVGCGHALFPYLLWRSGRAKHITGIELSPTTVECARKALQAAGNESDITLICTENPEDWPVEEYDVVSMIDVMHHIPPRMQHKFIVEMAKHVRSGGIILYKDMCKKPLWRALANRLHDLVLARQFIHYVPIQTIENWAVAEGLSCVHRDNINMLWYGHELRVFKKP